METQVEKEAVASDESSGRSKLVRRLGLMSAIAVLVGSTIGTGIFRSPRGIAARVPYEDLYLLLWVLGGFVTLCGALTLAELASALPRTGGIFVFLREGWGRLPAFLFGWSELVIIRASALGAISTVFAEYFLRLMAVESVGARRGVAAGAILLVALFNILGVQLGTLVQNLTTWAKYLALVGLVVAAFLIGGNRPAPTTGIDREAAAKADAVSGAALTTADVNGLLAIGTPSARVKELVEARGVSFEATPELEGEIKAAGGDDSLIEAMRRKSPQGTALLMLFGLAFISLLWVYDGWADLTFMSGEVKRPERVLPLALIIGTLAVIGIYLARQLRLSTPPHHGPDSELSTGRGDGGLSNAWRCGSDADLDCGNDLGVRHAERLDDDRAANLFRDGR